MKTAFWICLVVWLGGALLGQLTGNDLIHAISVNLFGLITIALGLIMLARWAWRKFGGSSGHGGLRRGMPIMSMTGVDPKAADICEKAIAADLFKPVGKRKDGAELLHVQSPQQDYLAVVEVVDGAIYLKAAYTTSPERLAHDIAELLDV